MFGPKRAFLDPPRAHYGRMAMAETGSNQLIVDIVGADIGDIVDII